jgi:hypothetical protein
MSAGVACGCMDGLVGGMDGRKGVRLGVMVSCNILLMIWVEGRAAGKRLG